MAPEGNDHSRTRAPASARARSSPLTLAAVLALAGCSSPTDDLLCTASSEPAIVLEIRDASTNRPAAGLATGIVQDGTYTDSLIPYEGLTADFSTLVSRRAADERPGTYAIFVQNSGYAPWSTAFVKVEQGACHVITRRIVARMEPLAHLVESVPHRSIPARATTLP